MDDEEDAIMLDEEDADTDEDGDDSDPTTRRDVNKEYILIFNFPMHIIIIFPFAHNIFLWL